ncbi:hypothetical protein EWM64_g7046 [Hericium alpestre]|uniref:Uncharacterized protein n=1 Tax=Hericium alpestre TaxID=135208 RepID=A0A4Y9ZSD9_9AGAM|nr:hypothetical protein EWM64_g7046 [Hericium alpestre]
MAAANYPNEDQVLKQISLRSFVLGAQGLFDQYRRVNRNREPDTAVFNAGRFIRYVLAGRSLNDHGQTVNRLIVNPRMGRVVDRPFEITRDYDSIIGVDKQIPYRIALAVFPVPPFSETLKKKNHIEVAVTIKGTETMVSLHNIPNLALGKVAQRHVVRCHFPALIDDNPMLSQAELAAFYNIVLRPSMVQVNPVHASHYPIDYTSAFMSSGDVQGRLHNGTIDIPHHCLNKLATAMLDRAEEDSRFAGMFFSHELRGSKGQAPHEPDDDEARQAALDYLFEFVDLDIIDRSSWKVDVAIEIRLPHTTVHWCIDNIPDILDLALPNISVPDRQCLVASIPKSYDGRGIQVDRDAQIGKLTKLLTDLECMSTVYIKAAGNQNATDQEGCARLEARISFEVAVDYLTEVPPAVLRSLICIPTKTFWLFKAYRLAALNIVFQHFQAPSPEIHPWRRSLTLGAVCIWMLNALNYRPDDYEPHRKLASLTCWNKVHIPAYDPNPDVEDPELGGVHPVHYRHGVWFLADIWTSDSIYRMPGSTNSADPDLLAQLYNYAHMGQIKSAFKLSTVRTPKGPSNPARTHNRNVRVTTDIAELQDLPDEDVVYFDDPVLAQIIVPPSAHPTGADMGPALLNDADSDVDLNVNLRLSRIWRQFAYDVFSEVPNPKKGTEFSYAKLTADKRSAITPRVFKKRDLTPYFYCVHIRMVSGAHWHNIQFARFFPCPNFAPPAGQKNFHACSYFIDWTNLMNRVSQADSIVIRDRLYYSFKQLLWVPFAATDRMWVSRTPDVNGCIPLGGITNRDPAPWLAINEIMSNTLTSFVLDNEAEDRQESNEEDEEIDYTEWE